MICTVIQNKDLQQIQDILKNCEMAEIRLDSCRLSLTEIQDLFTSDIPLVATCRLCELIKREVSLQDETLTREIKLIKASQIAEKRLLKAIESGASFVDVELEAPKAMSKRIRQAAHENGAVFMRSYHDFVGTDSVEALKALVDKCRYHGADMVKIVTTAASGEDCDKVLSLYNDYEPYGLIAFCMGEAGRQSRLDCLACGAPFTYASVSEDESAAPGQWSTTEMSEALYGERKFVGGEILTMPCAKSFAQRAIIAAALASGESHLHGYTSCADSEAALGVARAIGADVRVDGSDVTIVGIGAGLVKESPDSQPSFKGINTNEFFVGESGLLARLLIPLAAGLCKGSVGITGEKTLLTRSLDGVPAIMSSFGAKVISKPSDDAAQKAENASSGCFVPLTVEGPLVPGTKEVLGKYGSQLISGLLMALPFAEKNSALSVREPKSIPYMFITVEVLKKFGVKISSDMLGGKDFLESDGDWSLCNEIVFKVRGNQHLKAADVDLEGDWSAAANFLVAGAIFGKAEIDGLDTSSLQADLSIMDILMDAGASLSQLEGETGTVLAQRAPLSAFRVDATNCPDLFPIAAVLAAFCQGENHIGGVSRLAHKESDRGESILAMLTQMGVDAGFQDDELIVIGRSLPQRILTGTLLKGGNYSSHHDHRMAMALKIASLGADSPIVIDDEACMAKSFPEFNELFEGVSA